MRATALLGDARVLFLGIGTTAEQFARFCRPSGLVVVTPSLPTASLLGTRDRWTWSPWAGRSVRDELTCAGPVGGGDAGRFHFDLAVVGAAGFSARWGLTELDDAEAEIQRLAIERAERVVVIADGSKIGAPAMRSSARPSLIRTRWSPTTAHPQPELEALVGPRPRVHRRWPHRRSAATPLQTSTAPEEEPWTHSSGSSDRKPIIAMLHFPGLPGRPWHDARPGPAKAVDSLGRDLAVLQEAGVDGVMFCNEADLPVPAQGRAGDPGGDGGGHRDPALGGPRPVRGQHPVGRGGQPGARPGDRRARSSARC